MFDRDRVRLEGTIAGAGFASGDRVVAGIWERGPLGPMVDVMWARPDGARVLLAPDRLVARFVGGVYRFDEVHVVPVDLVTATGSRLHLVAGPLELELRAGREKRLFALRPKWLVRSPAWASIEDLLLRPLVGRAFLAGADGVRARGTSPSGVRQWYCIEGYREVLGGRAAIDGHDLGNLRALDTPAGFGFSEFPRQPALVRCAPVLEGTRPFLDD